MARKKKLGCSLPLLASALTIALLAELLSGDSPPAVGTPSKPDVAQDAPKKPRARKTRKPTPSPFPADSPWASRDACEAALHAHGNETVPRIGTWNLAWFPAGTADGKDPERARDVRWMACIIASLGVQVLAVQEVVQNPKGRAALLDLLAMLDTFTQGRWRAELDDCPDDGRQHVGFLYDEARVKLVGTSTLGELNPLRSACDGRLRPGVAARFWFHDGGPDFDAISVHLDSGTIARDYEHRAASLARLDAAIAKLRAARSERDDDVFVLGDFNTMGCQTCEPKVEAGDEIAALDAVVDAFRPSLRNLVPEHACTHYYRGRGGRLDHVLATRGMRELGAVPKLTAHGACQVLRCEKASGITSLPTTLRLSDHCPLVLTLEAVDAD